MAQETLPGAWLPRPVSQPPDTSTALPAHTRLPLLQLGDVLKACMLELYGLRGLGVGFRNRGLAV